MSERNTSTLPPLFRRQDVQAVAHRLSHASAEVLHSAGFQKAMEDLDHHRMGGEANTREKIIEPIVYRVLGYQPEENDAEHAIQYAGAGGETGSVEYFFRIGGNNVPIEAKTWEKPLDKKDGSRRSPVRQGLEYAVHSSSRWFIVTNGSEWRLYKTQLKGSQSPLSACERYLLKDIVQERNTFLRFFATFGREAFVTSGEGLSRLDELRRMNEGWQESIGSSLYDKLVESRVNLFREIQRQFSHLSQEEVNEAVVKLLFRIMFIFFAEHAFLLEKEFLVKRLIARFEADQQWSASNGTLYHYVQQYFRWLDGREPNNFDIYPYDGALFDSDPILDSRDLRIDDRLLKDVLLRLSREGVERSIDYAQINPRILGNIYERFLGFVIEIKEGRINPQAERDTRREEGSVYTPEPVTRFLVEHCVEQAQAARPDLAPWELRCLDPACGSGHFLVEYVNHVAQLCEERDETRTLGQWKRYLTENCVFGVDKDPTAVMLTKLSLWINSAMKAEPFATIDTHIKCGNSLVCGCSAGFRLPAAENRDYAKRHRELKKRREALVRLEKRAERDRSLLTVEEGRDFHAQIRAALADIDEAKKPILEDLSRQLRQHWPCLQQARPFHWEVEFAEVFEDRGGFDVLVGNPPWGANLADIRDYLEGGAFQLARGQYDSYELFIELGRRLLREGGAFGFIVPDSITLPEHEPLRRLLLDNVSLTCLARAGEGIFPAVFRAAYFVCFINEVAQASQRVRVATLRKAHRKQMEEDTLFDPMKTVWGIVCEIGHDRRQSEFAGNPHAEFDVLATTQDRRVIKAIDSHSIDWCEITTTGRGVELGKTGEVLQCPYCYRWDTMPAKSKGRYGQKECAHCRRVFKLDAAASRKAIISQRRHGKSWRPLLVGESINRYCLSEPLWIDVSVDGINYKSEKFYLGKRLLVRKTGVGIMACIDSSEAYTNQVVFTWKLRDDLEPPHSHYRLEYVLAVLNSRLMLYRLCTMSGEAEWRSFPYVTQKTIQQLPVRAIDFCDAHQRRLHDEIADRVAAVIAGGKPPTDHEDYQIEKLVMQLYGITKPMCRRIFEVLHEVQRLRIIREMNIAQPDMLLDALPD